MATCDCSGADKAYVIVNPNSVNRREILSLNPPICHDVKTKGLLINGQPFTGWGEIQSWTTELQSGSGIEVDWGGGDIDILPGETWGISSFGLYSVTISAYGGSQTATTPNVISSAGSFGRTALSISQLCALDAPIISGNVGTLRACDNCARFNISSQWMITTDGGIARTTSGAYLGANCNNGIPSISAVLTSSSTKVTTNTGATSTRQTTSNPLVSLQPGDCILTITYTDGKTQTLTYPECPTVEPLQCLEVSDQGGVLDDICPYNGEQIAFQCDERKCPPETCCELECGGGRVCCYGPNSGTAIDSFIRRT
ncbi:hypothetical protein [Picosynechococcus sp. NKBG042902]|uniref:hypothetical protein n=1 Tax=Picosynechococcus sp. NKBG042902 TaxID=490193 RepID=UPI000AB2EF84|nr:hypothetical protein [Picosynechococcus sp. NKBG042902]